MRPLPNSSQKAVNTILKVVFGLQKDSNKSFSFSLKENIKTIKDIFGGDSVLRVRPFEFAGGQDGCLIYFDGMVNVDLINQSVLRPLVLALGPKPDIPVADWVADELLYASEIKKTSLISDAVSAMLYGDTLLLLEGSAAAITVNTKGWRSRGISEPENERVLQGPREGFDEAAMFNLAMIRRRLQTPDFCSELLRLGRRTNTIVFICYLRSIVNRDVLRELKYRLSKIDIDSVLDSQYITEQIRDHKSSLFKTVGATERPDVVAAGLLEGRVALIVDGTPVVITVPYLFSENFQSDEDYFISYNLASAGRIMRMFAFFLAISVPAIYLALSTFHFELLPTAFALTVSVSRSGVPFSSLAECVILTIIFEILRETGIRMPQSVGHALSIVGGLVVGQAAVEAKLVSAPILIVVALSGICGLMVPRLRTAVFYIRFLMIFAAGFFGLYGYLFSAVLLIISILRKRSFGIDATLSLNTVSFQGFKDVLFRTSWKNMITRPAIQNENVIRKKK